MNSVARLVILPTIMSLATKPIKILGTVKKAYVPISVGIELEESRNQVPRLSDRKARCSRQEKETETD
jgi:hypothetical protein